MKVTGEVQQLKTNMIGSMKIVAELQLKIVENAVSLKMSEISTKAAAGKKIQDGNPVWLWTLPNGTVTGDPIMVGDYFCRLVMDKPEEFIKVNYMKILKDMIAELDKLTVEIVGEHSSMEA